MTDNAKRYLIVLSRAIWLAHCSLENCDCTDKGKPVVRQGRKAVSLSSHSWDLNPRNRSGRLSGCRKRSDLRLALISTRRTPLCAISRLGSFHQMAAAYSVDPLSSFRRSFILIHSIGQSARFPFAGTNFPFSQLTTESLGLRHCLAACEAAR